MSDFSSIIYKNVVIYSVCRRSTQNEKYAKSQNSDKIKKSSSRVHLKKNNEIIPQKHKRKSSMQN